MRWRYVLVLTCWPVAGLVRPADPATVRQQVRRAAAEATALPNAFARCVTSNTAHAEGTSKEVQYEIDLAVRRRGSDRQQVEVQRPGPGTDPAGFRSVVNNTCNRYAFQLQRRRHDTTGWTLTRFENGRTDWWPPTGRVTFDLVWALASGPGVLHHGHVPLAEMFDDPTFRLTPAADPVADRARIGFTYNPASAKGDRGPFRAGHIDFAPDRNWVVTGYEFDGEWANAKGRVTAVTEERPGGGVTLTVRTLGPTGQPVATSVSRYDPVVLDRLTDDDFSLSAFGLPEPVRGGSSRHTPVSVWLLVAAGVVAAAAVLFRWLRQRTTNLTPLPPVPTP